MFLDSTLEFSKGQVLSASGVSTDKVDLSSDRDIGVGRQLYVIFQLTQAADGANSNETYKADLQTSVNSAFTTPINIGSVTIPRGDPVGSQYSIGFPFNNKRYIRVNYTLGGTSPSVGVSAWLSPTQPTTNMSYPNAENA